MAVCEAREGATLSCFEDEVREVDEDEEEWEPGRLDPRGDPPARATVDEVVFRQEARGDGADEEAAISGDEEAEGSLRRCFDQVWLLFFFFFLICVVDSTVTHFCLFVFCYFFIISIWFLNL